MFFKQYYLGCLSHASYLIVDENSKTAVVVDPQRDTDQYLHDAAEQGAEIRHVCLTHFHADFLAGHLELQAKTGATIHLGTAAHAEYDIDPLIEGQALSLGSVRIEVLDTPGHTPESVCYLVFDETKDRDRPHAVLTGDTLFIGDVGRPDLLVSAGMTSQELAGMMYDSLHRKLLPLPDETLVYPAHGAGSMCGRNLSTDTFSTLGQQRATNYALQPMSKEEFVGIVAINQPQQPAYFALDAKLNQSQHGSLEEALGSSRPVSLDELLREKNAGAQVLDTREAGPFCAGHLVDAINIGLDGRFATWAGSLLAQDRPIFLITDPGKEHEAALRLGRIGFDHVRGYLEGGMSALEGRSDLLRRHERMGPEELRERLQQDAPVVVDVRAPGEREGGYIEGSLNVPLMGLSAAIDELPRDRELVFVCKTGYRSASAMSLVDARGFEHVSDLDGGMDAWLGIDEGCD